MLRNSRETTWSWRRLKVNSRDVLRKGADVRHQRSRETTTKNPKQTGDMLFEEKVLKRGSLRRKEGQ